jgi:hypothetical protein
LGDACWRQGEIFTRVADLAVHQALGNGIIAIVTTIVFELQRDEA